MSAPVVERRSRALIWWGVVLLLVGVLGGVIAVVGMVRESAESWWTRSQQIHR